MAEGNRSKYSRNERILLARKVSKFLKFITNQEINIIYCVVAQINEVRIWNRKNIDNYVEIYIKSNPFIFIKSFFDFKNLIWYFSFYIAVSLDWFFYLWFTYKSIVKTNNIINTTTKKNITAFCKDNL